MDKPIYKLGDVVTCNDKVYVVIHLDKCQDCRLWQYTLAPYDENLLEYMHEADISEYIET